MILVVAALLAVVCAYVLGSIPTGLWLGLRLRGIDIREHGSKNIGATNTLRVLGKKLGAAALAADLAKGLVPVALARAAVALYPTLWDVLPVLCGLAAILGHSFSLFLRFRGGKGVATSTGVFLALAPIPTLTGAFVFAAVLIGTQMVSAGSISAAVAVSAMVFAAPTPVAVRIFTLVVAVLVIVKHRSNLGRIFRGEEGRMWDPEKGRRLPHSPAGFHGLVATDYAAAVLAALGAFAVYVRTLAPTVTGEDSGELITAAFSLGIPHPPGYPVWTMLAHAFTWLPMGEVAWRVNLSSAFFAAAAVFLIVLLICMLTRSRFAGLVGALAFAVSHEFWEQALIAEVYALNTFFVALCVFLLWRWHEGRQHGERSDRRLWMLAVVYGISLGNHNTMLLLGPLFALYVLAVERAFTTRWPRYAGMTLLAGLCAFLVYLYAPIRSLADPAMDWGDPETPGRFWAMVWRRQYAFMLTQYPHGLGRLAGQMAAMLGLWAREYAIWFGLAGLGGFVLLAMRRAWQALFLGSVSLLTVTALTLIQNPNLDKEWMWVMSVFGIPAYLATGLCIGVAVSWLLGRCRAPSLQAVVALAAVAGIAAQAGLHWRSNDKSDYYWVHDYSENVLNALEEDAVYIPYRDHASFSARYSQAVEGLRPDVIVGRVCGYLEPDLMALVPAEMREEAGALPKADKEAGLVTWLLRHTDRPFYFGRRPKLPEAPEIRFEQAGLVWRALRPGETAEKHDYWNSLYQWRTLEYENARGDYTAELILYEIKSAQAQEAFRRNESSTALALLEEALEHYGADPNILNNVGVMCARHGQMDAARRYFKQAQTLSPENTAVRDNLGRLSRP